MQSANKLVKHLSIAERRSVMLRPTKIKIMIQHLKRSFNSLIYHTTKSQRDRKLLQEEKIGRGRRQKRPCGESIRKSRDRVQHNFVVGCIHRQPISTLVTHEHEVQIRYRYHWLDDMPPIRITCI